MTKTFDPAKPVQTRDGRKARIISTSMAGVAYPIGALVEALGGGEHFEVYTPKGRYSRHESEGPDDLVNVPERVVTYRTFNFGQNIRLGGLVSTTASEAQEVSGGWDGVLQLTMEDGKFLSAEVVPA